jgi:hypothetical protein
MLRAIELYPHQLGITELLKRLSRSEIDLLIESLQKEARLRDKNSKKEREKERSGITIIDFVSEIPMPIRLKHALLSFESSQSPAYIDDVTENKLLLYRNLGKKSWEQFIHIIDHSLHGTRFEAKQKILQKHFAENS